jgi:hypothetical protein
MTMKKIFNIMFAAVAICLTAACQKEEGPKAVVDPAIVGEWHLSTVEVDGAVQTYPYDVYFAINSDGTFELYQKSGTQVRYTKFTGTCRSEGQILSGIYSSGTPWGDSYTAIISGGLLVLTSSDGVEVQEYEKGSLNQEEKLAANISTRAMDEISPVL